MSRRSLTAYLELDRLCCPGCKGRLSHDADSLLCVQCSMTYEVVDGIPVVLQQDTRHSETKGVIRRFWGELYQAAHTERVEEYEPTAFLGLLDELERMFLHRQHLAVTEMPIHDLSGKAVLEIGSGAGAHSALFAQRGAEMTSVDITFERVLATARKLDWVSTEGHFTLQADAEHLPFRDARFDIVYSNGVLHHTPNTRQAIVELYRVLKPGGRAVVMLYARHSFMYWVNLFLLRGLLRGEIFRRPNWLGQATEWMSSEPQRVLNPETKVFSAGEVRRLFSRFSAIRIRKNSFNFDMVLSLFANVPKVGPPLRTWVSKWLERRQGMCAAGVLVYGAPYRYETALELALGRWIGFGLNILAVK